MTEDERRFISQEIRLAVRETVNGRFDPNSPTYCLRAIDQHMIETKEIMEAFKGFKTIGELVKWVSGVGVAAVAIYALLKGNLKL